MRSIGAVSLGFLAGVVLAVTVAVSAPTVAAGDPGPCSPELERAYEIVRFARYSHVPWLEWALELDPAHVAPGGQLAEDANADPDFQRWWIDEYGTAMDLIEAVCQPAEDYPLLDDLPSSWETYPERGFFQRWEAPGE